MGLLDGADKVEPKSGLLSALAQTWPARAVKGILSAVTLPGDVYQGNVSMYGADGHTNPEVINRSADLAGLVMGGGAGAGAGLSHAGEFSLGVVPVDAAKAFGLKSRLPTEPGFEAAVRNTKGAAIDDGMLRMQVQRNQRPDQELSESVRGGVFYLPPGDKNARFYSGKNENFAYGGSQRVEGETAFSAPLFVKGATGGKAPEAAYDQLLGKGSYQNMRSDAIRSVTGLPQNDRVHIIEDFLDRYAPEMSGMGHHILSNSTKGNQLAYALQEAAVSSAARKAGHDGVVGFSTSRKTKEPFISEVFDVRERSYPSPHGDYDLWPIEEFGLK